MGAEPSTLDPSQYGWSRENITNVLISVPLPLDTSPAPLDVLKMIGVAVSLHDHVQQTDSYFLLQNYLVQCFAVAEVQMIAVMNRHDWYLPMILMKPLNTDEINILCAACMTYLLDTVLPDKKDHPLCHTKVVL